MKAGRYKTRLRRLLTCLGPCAIAIVGCERPSYTYSDDVPIKGTGANVSTFAGTSFVGGSSFTAGGTAPLDPCALDRSVGASPIFAKQAISNQLPVRSQLYAQLTLAEVEALKKGGSLIPPPLPASAPFPLTSVLTNTLVNSTELRKVLLTDLRARFAATRALWPNPWALRLLEHPGTERMSPVRITLNEKAWVVRLTEGLPPTVVDLNNGVVPIEQATANLERIAAIYYVIDDRISGGSLSSCEAGKRELALGNEDMVEEFSIGTPEILARLNADIDDLTAFFSVVRPCTSVERGFGTFHSFTVCQTWHFFDASTEYSAYQWALSNPMEAYKPKTQNLATLIDALKNDRFEPDPFVGDPPPTRPIVGQGGMAGASGDSSLGGAAQGGAVQGGAPP